MAQFHRMSSLITIVWISNVKRTSPLKSIDQVNIDNRLIDISIFQFWKLRKTVFKIRRVIYDGCLIFPK